MEWSAFLSGLPMGIALPALMALELYRRLDKGDLVLGREHRRVLDAVDELTAAAERITEEQRQAQKAEREALLETIEVKRRTIQTLEALLERSQS